MHGQAEPGPNRRNSSSMWHGDNLDVLSMWRSIGKSAKHEDGEYSTVLSIVDIMCNVKESTDKTQSMKNMSTYKAVAQNST